MQPTAHRQVRHFFRSAIIALLHWDGCILRPLRLTLLRVGRIKKLLWRQVLSGPSVDLLPSEAWAVISGKVVFIVVSAALRVVHRWRDLRQRVQIFVRLVVLRLIVIEHGNCFLRSNCRLELALRIWTV